MRYVYRFWLLAALYACLLPAGADEQLAVVTAADSPLQNISVENLKLVYQRKILVDQHGERWIPLNLKISDPLRQTFSLALFASLPEEQEDYWNMQYFHGISPPQVLASEEAVLRFVAMTPGAIGYVRRQLVDERVKVLQTIVPPVVH